jgi:hypothetical protein
LRVWAAAACTLLAFAGTEEKCAYLDSREFPGNRKESQVFSALYAARGGEVYAGLCTHAGSSQFYKYDPRTGRIEHIAGMGEFLGQTGRGVRVAGKIHTRFVEDRQGRIYFATMCEDSGPTNIDPYSWDGPNWMRYDPRAGKVENLGSMNRLWGAYGLAIDEKRNRLFATTWDGHLYRYDIDDGRTHDLGRVDNWDDVRHIASDDEGNVYGPYPKARIWKYDARTERVYDLSVQFPYDHLVFPRRMSNPMLDRKAIWRVVDWDPVDRVLYGVDGSSSLLFKYDPKDGPEGKATFLARLCAERFIESDRKDIPFSTLAFTVGKDRKIYHAATGMEFDYEARLESNELARKRGDPRTTSWAELITYDLKTRRRENLGLLRTTGGAHVFGCGAATCGPDGTIYFVGGVEEKDPAKAAGKTGGVAPYALRLLLYKPK